MKRLEPLAPGEFYHFYNRGVDKRDIFLDDFDFLRFVVLLYLCNSKEKVFLPDLLRNRELEDLLLLERHDNLVEIGAFCLMPNHFHILIKIPENGGVYDGALFMQKLITGYVMYFNKKYGRTGALLEGRFKSQYVGDDNYLKYLFSYIHLNPVKLIKSDWRETGIDKGELSRVHSYLAGYKYSSYLEYTDKPRNDYSNILSREAFPDYFVTGENFIGELNDWLSFKE